jgi:hypothetical protein
MFSSNFSVFGVSVVGKHPDLLTKRFYGIANSIEEAIDLTKEKATSDGWTSIKIDDISNLGTLSFAKCPCLDESEVEICQS